MSALEQFVLQMGFESLVEFNRLVASVDLQRREHVEAFKRWQDEDGTKAGLVALIEKQAHEDTP